MVVILNRLVQSAGIDFTPVRHENFEEVWGEGIFRLLRTSPANSFEAWTFHWSSIPL